MLGVSHFALVAAVRRVRHCCPAGGHAGRGMWRDGYHTMVTAQHTCRQGLMSFKPLCPTN